MDSICNCIHNYITDDIKNAFYHIRILLNNTRNTYLKIIASETLLKGSIIRTDLIKFQYYLFVLHIPDTKLYKSEQTKEKKKSINILAQ